MSIFSQYHLNFLKALLDNGVRFLIIGGQAAIYYGVRRSTGDLDILIEPTRTNGERLLQAFYQLNLQTDEIKPEEFELPLFLGLGFEPDAVDILTLTPGIDFRLAFEHALEILDSGMKMKIISLDDLIKNKESMGRDGEKRLMDEYDVVVLKKIRKGNA